MLQPKLVSRYFLSHPHLTTKTIENISNAGNQIYFVCYELCHASPIAEYSYIINIQSDAKM